MWDPQMPALLSRFQVLRPDLRGHGASDAPTGDYTIAQLWTQRGTSALPTVASR
jgi:3-oxoadipate enol-lactonase/4-carboxymuconolactone decarboxylase